MTARKARPSAEALAGKLMVEYTQRIDAEYRQARADAAEHLHEGIMAVLEDQSPSVETILYVFGLIQHNLLSESMKRLFEAGASVMRPEPPAAGEMVDAQTVTPIVAVI